MSKERNSSIELLRILAIVLIVMMHAAGYGLNSGELSTSMGVVAINSVGNMGVTLFVLISGYFGIRFRPSKLIKLWAMMLVYSVAAYVFNIAIGEKEININGIYKALTPVTSVEWWFMTCYVILFILSPLINRIAERFSQKEFLYLLGVLSFFFVISPTFLQHTITNDSFGKGLPNFFLAYLIGQYIRKYNMPKKIENHSCAIFIACIVILFSVSLLGKIKLGANVPALYRDNDLFIISGAICLFLCMRRQVWHNRQVNYAAGFVFPLYLANLPLIGYLHKQYIIGNNALEWIPYFATIAEVIAITAIFEIIRRFLLDRAIIKIGSAADKKFNIQF